jgi:hypothetical protein
MNMTTNPTYESRGINAAIVNQILEDFSNELREGYYICDGSRNVQHITAFQDYLEKYFGFRKAFCRLNIVYNPKIRWLIKLIYPFRGVLARFDSIHRIHQINGVLKMEEICRKDMKQT